MGIFDRLGAWFDRQSTTGKALVGVGVVGAVTLAAQSATAQRLLGSPGDLPTSGPVGDRHRNLPALAAVRLPETAHLRAAPRANAAAGDRELPAGTVVVIERGGVTAPIPGMARGPNETAYYGSAHVPGGDPRYAVRGYFFVPNNAVFVTSQQIP